MSHNPLAVALEMHMKSAKERNAELATLRSHLETATAENERLREQVATLERAHRAECERADTRFDEAMAYRRSLETARKALEAGKGIVAKFKVARDSDDELAIIHELEAWSRALDTQPATPSDPRVTPGKGETR